MPISRASASRLAVYLQILLGVALFFLVDAAVFRSGFYLHWISPVSGLGNMVRAINDIAAIPDGSKSILVIGDSRIGEGFSALLADAEAVRSGAPLTFTSGGVAGTTPRVWYYLLRQIRDPGKRLAAVAIMTPSFHDNDDGLPAERAGDIVFVHPLLRLADIIDFPASFSSFATRREAAEAILFNGLFYKNDISISLRTPASASVKQRTGARTGWSGSRPTRATMARWRDWRWISLAERSPEALAPLRPLLWSVMPGNCRHPMGGLQTPSPPPPIVASGGDGSRICARRRA